MPEVSEHFRPPSLPVQTIWCFLFSGLCNHEGCAGLLTAEPELRAGPGRHLAPIGGAVHEEVSSEDGREGIGRWERLKGATAKETSVARVLESRLLLSKNVLAVTGFVFCMILTKGARAGL